MFPKKEFLAVITITFIFTMGLLGRPSWLLIPQQDKIQKTNDKPTVMSGHTLCKIKHDATSKIVLVVTTHKKTYYVDLSFFEQLDQSKKLQNIAIGEATLKEAHRQALDAIKNIDSRKKPSSGTKKRSNIGKK